MLLLSLVLSSASAADSVLWFSPDRGYSIRTLRATLSYSGVALDEAKEWPERLTDYRVVFLVTPETGFDAAQVEDVSDALDAGSIVVLVGDTDTYFSASLDGFDELAAELGLSTRFGAATLDASCEHYAKVLHSGWVTDGVEDVEYAYSTHVEVGGDGVAVLAGTSGQHLVATEGQVVFAADVTLFTDDCGWPADAGNARLALNLVQNACAVAADVDGDGFDAFSCGGDDCDDRDPREFPGAVGYADLDGDGVGDLLAPVEACVSRDGWAADPGDCDDTSPGVHPGAAEVCDGIDQDCDRLVDEDAVDPIEWYVDPDRDGFGDLTGTRWACSEPPGYAATADDCANDNPFVFPGQDERCNLVDDNCDGAVDHDAIDGTAWFADLDGDTWGADASAVSACVAPEGFVAWGGDCDDADAGLHPDADEACNARDDDCDGLVDDELPSGTWYADADGDGHGDPETSVLTCGQPAGFVSTADDCDDADPALWEIGGAGGCAGADDGAVVGVEVEAEPRGEAGCASTGATPRTAWLALLALVGLRRRRAS